jgi:uncharacterized membrane protein YesL
MREKLPHSLQVIINGLMLWWDNWLMMVLLNWILALSWLTIILGPPVTFGVYYFGTLSLKETQPGIRDFYEGFKQYFGKSWLWMGSNILVILILYANFLFYSQMSGFASGVMVYISISLFVFWLMVQLYALPYYMLQDDKSLLLAWRNALFTILAFPLYTFFIFVVCVLFIVLNFRFLFPMLGGALLIVVMICICAVHERIERLKIIR